jgi:hypothetical protein
VTLSLIKCEIWRVQTLQTGIQWTKAITLPDTACWRITLFPAWLVNHLVLSVAWISGYGMGRLGKTMDSSTSQIGNTVSGKFKFNLLLSRVSNIASYKEAWLVTWSWCPCGQDKRLFNYFNQGVFLSESFLPPLSDQPLPRTMTLRPITQNHDLKTHYPEPWP